ncbi:MAG: porin family protein [Hyphomonadaceae bacterium]|nr:porin family protein [Hyphomonadaceae bacterium]
MAKNWLATTAIALGVVAAPAVAAAEDVTWRAFAGGSSLEDLDGFYYGYDVSFESGWVVGGAMGVRRGDFTFEGEVSHRTANFDEIDFGSYTADIDGEVSTTAIMANAWYNAPRMGSIGFYVGGGIGYAKTEAESGAYTESGNDWAWQVGAGANIRHNDQGFTYGIGYRYFAVDSDIEITSHNVMFEVGKNF